MTEVREALTALGENLTQLRFTGQSRDLTVSAVVDGQSTLLDIVIDNKALRGGFPERVGQSITQAVTVARQQAVKESAKLLDQTLGGFR